ncbi:MAG: ATP-binding protein, partial [Rhodospirillales bacterium]
ANASHELRSPLAALLGFIETLEGPAGGDEDTRIRFLGIMLREAKRMALLIDDLLSLSRVEINEHVRPTAPVDIAGVLLNVTEALSVQAKVANVPIRVNYGSNLPTVHGEGDQLFQVFRNLIENAIRYGAKGEAIDVRVEAAQRIPGSGRSGVAIKVTDHGEGIPEEAIPRLTERFYRVDKARSKSVGGTGLGLAIVKHIVNRHRGHLAVESTLGKGSTFTVYLPAEPPRQGMLPGGEAVAMPSSDVS